MLIIIRSSHAKVCGLACARMTASTRNGLMSRRGCGKAACYHRYCYCSTCPSLLRYTSYALVIVRFSQDKAIVRDLVQLGDYGIAGIEEQEPLACVRRVVWVILYADDAGIVSKSAEGPAKMMTFYRDCLRRSAGLTVPEKKTETMLLPMPDQTNLAPPLVIEAAGQSNKQTTQFLYLRGNIHENADLSLEIDRWMRLMRAWLKRFGPDLYDRTTAPLCLKIRTS